MGKLGAAGLKLGRDGWPIRPPCRSRWTSASGVAAPCGLVIGITAALKSSDYWCLTRALALLSKDDPSVLTSGRLRRRGIRGLVLFAGQKPYPTWRQALPPPEEPRRDPPAPDSAGATSNNVVPAPRQSLLLPIVLGVIGLAVIAVCLIGFLATLTAPPALAPSKTATALPALETEPPPLASATSNSAEQPIEPEERLSRLEPPPIQIGPSPQESVDIAPPRDSAPLVDLQSPLPEAAPPAGVAPLPPSRPVGSAPLVNVAPSGNSPTSNDQSTAIYDISAHTVYLPDGMRLEAHSGLGDRIDDPRFVDERDHGATPPGVYQLTLRESMFHGVQALRLNPVDTKFTFNRVGLLAHPYMLGPNGDSNGCVSFKNYDVFLRAFQSGGVRRLAVVAQWTGGPPRQGGVFASLRQTSNR
jgi:hypothetical protein